MKMTYKVKGDFKGLNQLLANLQDAKNFKAQVGVVGDKTKRVQGALTNADIALIHEQGVVSRNIPRRSIFNSINIKKDELNTDIRKIILRSLQDKEPTYNAYFRMALAVLKVVKGSFDTEGYGTWPPNAPTTIKKKLRKVKAQNKENAQIITMVDTGALERSLTFRVVRQKADKKILTKNK